MPGRTERGTYHAPGLDDKGMDEQRRRKGQAKQGTSLVFSELFGRGYISLFQRPAVFAVVIPNVVADPLPELPQAQVFDARHRVMAKTCAGYAPGQPLNADVQRPLIVVGQDQARPLQGLWPMNP